MGDDGRVGEGGRRTLGGLVGAWARLKASWEVAILPKNLYYHYTVIPQLKGQKCQQISESRNLCMTASHYRRRGLKVLVPAAMATAVVFLGAFILRKGRREGWRRSVVLLCSQLLGSQAGRAGEKWSKKSLQGITHGRPSPLSSPWAKRAVSFSLSLCSQVMLKCQVCVRVTDFWL